MIDDLIVQRNRTPTIRPAELPGRPPGGIFRRSAGAQTGAAAPEHLSGFGEERRGGLKSFSDILRGGLSFEVISGS